jgi:hypothetical protein
MIYVHIYIYDICIYIWCVCFIVFLGAPWQLIAVQAAGWARSRSNMAVCRDDVSSLANGVEESFINLLNI